MISLSILIPVRNCNALPLAIALQQQAEHAHLSAYELLVVDDASNQDTFKDNNRTIATLPHARLIELDINRGRAAVRNLLWKEARYDWLLFIDGDMQINRDDFLETYIQTIKSPQQLITKGPLDACDAISKTKDRLKEESTPIVICGDYELQPPTKPQQSLRYLYERRVKLHRSLYWRQHHPYRAFRVCNLMIRRDVMKAHPFNEKVQHYGYEDLLLGRNLQESNIAVTQIDNQVLFNHFDDNDLFLRKSEIAMESLWALRDKLGNLSLLVRLTNLLQQLHIVQPLRIILKPFLPSIKKNLTGLWPSLTLFQIYKLGYYLEYLKSSN